ncbi:MAG: permease-like cell division protein FtsX [Patescibacteria group bacterium]|nr:permease-like cell division protein FtsX [Patescibacteria group bacterium]
MIATTIKRIIKTGFTNFWRNGIVSISSILMMTVTLSVVIFLLLSSNLFSLTLERVKNEIDINVYATTGATPEEVLELKQDLEFLPEVDIIEYISREQVLSNFREKHRNDEQIIQALEELEENPFGAVLNIKAKEISQYSGIAKFLESKTVLSGEDPNIVEKVNYAQNKIIIEGLNKTINAVQKFGIALVIILIVVSVLITFNTIRLVIFISREEIKVMRLVGANNSFIRGPFIFEGIIYGVVASLITVTLSYPILFWLNPFIEKIFLIDLLSYFFSNILIFFGVSFMVGVSLGVVSSILAVRKYLKV